MNYLYRIAFLLVLFFWLGYELNAQIDFDNYHPAYGQGSIPTVFIEKGESKAIEQYKDNEDIDLEYLVLSNYLINEILLSGDVLFGDPMTLYINKVADKILINDPKLRSELQFFTLKSNTVNAMATSGGIVFVTTGLLSYVKNESQLAFILCHEIQHYKLKHSFKQYKRTKKITNDESKGLSTDEKIRRIYKFSRKNESEADSKGFALFRTTSYSLKEAINSFVMLQNSDLSFTGYNFSIADFETEKFKISPVITRKALDLYSTKKKENANNS